MSKIGLGPTYFNGILFINENLDFWQSFSELDMHCKIIFKVLFLYLERFLFNAQVTRNLVL